MFWIVFILFVFFSVALTAVILMQEPKQGGLGEGLGGGGGGQDFGTMRGTAGGLNRLTIWFGLIWGFLALMLSIIPRF